MQFTAIIHGGAQLFGPASLPGSAGLLPSFGTDGNFSAWVAAGSHAEGDAHSGGTSGGIVYVDDSGNLATDGPQWTTGLSSTSAAIGNVPITAIGTAGQTADLIVANDGSSDVFTVGAAGETYMAEAVMVSLETASPNDTDNVVAATITGGTTNADFAIVPKGSGGIIAGIPDGTAAGGNVRGTYCVDLQTKRSSANQVASAAQNSTISGGANNKAEGNDSTVIGGNGGYASGIYATVLGCQGSSATKPYSTVSGRQNVASGDYSGLWGGNFSTASGHNAQVIGGSASIASGSISLATGMYSLAPDYGQESRSVGGFSGAGEAQSSKWIQRKVTTNATPTTLANNNIAERLNIVSGKILFSDILISGVKSDGSAAACYKRKVAIKNVGGTTSLVGSVETIGTDIEDNALSNVAITADDTNDALQINVTGIAAETWRWVAIIEGLEITYGT